MKNVYEVHVAVTGGSSDEVQYVLAKTMAEATRDRPGATYARLLGPAVDLHQDAG